MRRGSIDRLCKEIESREPETDPQLRKLDESDLELAAATRMTPTRLPASVSAQKRIGGI
jgi:hypothetical protein